MSKLPILITGFFTMLLLCGCPSTYFSAQVLEIGYTESYADLSRIENATVYKYGNKNYIKAPIMTCELESDWYAARPGAATDYINIAESPAQFIEIDESTKEFLCKKNYWDDQYLPEKLFYGQLSDLEQLPANAVKLKVENLPGNPQLGYDIWGNSFLDKTIYLESDRNWKHFAAMPLLLLTVPTDIAATVAMTVFQVITMPAVELYHYSLRK